MVWSWGAECCGFAERMAGIVRTKCHLICNGQAVTNGAVELTVAQTAQAVGKSEGYIRQHIKRGHLESTLVNGARVVDLKALLRWAQTRELEVDLNSFGGLGAFAQDETVPR